MVFFSARNDPAQLTNIVDRVEAGQVQFEISDRRPLAEARLLHHQSEADPVRGRVPLIPER